MADVAVSVTDLAKTYTTGLFRRSTVHALRGVTLEVEPGTVFGLLGPNGAGKTTLVKILLGIVHASAGDARLFGTPVSDPSARARIGFLPEDHEFPSFLTAEQVLHVYGKMSGVDVLARDERIPHLLDRVGLLERRDSKVESFSKGMKQRLGLAQALLNDPDLLFLDEPTDGVDPVGRRDVRDLLLWLREQGTTIFLNSHLLSEVEKVCSQLAILNNGEIIRRGTVGEITAVDRAYDVVCTPLPDALKDALDGHLRPAPSADRPADPALRRYRIQADDRTTLNALLDRFRAEDVELESVSPLRRSLEESFIDVVGSEESRQK